MLTNAWPEVGALLEANSVCTTTLVGCRTAITAAHCVCTETGTGAPCNSGGNLADPTSLVVFAPQIGVLPIESIRVAPNYVFGSSGDIAVLALSIPVRGVRPRAINEGARPAFGTAGTIVGFGRTQQGSLDSGVLRAGVVQTASCNPSIPNATHLCWLFQHPLGPPGTESNTCPGDSGGPLLVDFGAGPVVAGVHSGGLSGTCSGDDSSFDTDVFVQRTWIRAQTGVDLDQDACGDGFQVGDAETTTQSWSGVVSFETAQTFVVPAGTKLLRVGMQAATAGDVDLYVRRGAPPTTAVFDCSSAFTGSFEFCEIEAPEPGTWHVLLGVFGDPVPYQLTASMFPENSAPPPPAVGQVLVSNFASFEITQTDLANGDRAIASSTLRGYGPPLGGPEGIALARDGSLLVANPFEVNLLRMDPVTGDREIVSGCLDATCTASVGAGSRFFQPRFVALDAAGQLLVADRSTPGVYAIVRVNPVTGDRTLVSGCTNATCTPVVGAGPAIGRLFGIAVEASGSIVVADGLAVYRIDRTSGDRTILSGCPNAACTAPVGTGPAFGEPVDMVVDASGALFVTYQIEGSVFGALRRVDPVTGARTLISGCQELACTTVRGSGPRFQNLFGIAFAADGNLLVTDSELDAVLRVHPVNGGRTLLAGCANAGCSTATGSGPAFAEPLDIAVIPEPAPSAGALVAIGALFLGWRRQSTRFTAGGFHSPETASGFGQ